MRVKANTVPQPFELGHPQSGKVRVLLRENVRYLSENEVEYDEYTIDVPNYPTLAEDLSRNTRAWIAYGRQLETPENSSAIWHLNQERDEELAAMVDAVYQTDIEMIGLEEEENVQPDEETD